MGTQNAIAAGIATIPFVRPLVHIGQFYFDASAVKPRAKALLNTIQLVDTTLETVKALKLKNGISLDQDTSRWISQTVIPQAENALARVAEIVEAARVDLKTNFDRVRWITKTVFVMRESAKVSEAISLLTASYQGLTTALGLLDRSSGSQTSAINQSRASMRDEFLRDPRCSSKCYAETGFLRWRRNSCLDLRQPLKNGSDIENMAEVSSMSESAESDDCQVNKVNEDLKLLEQGLLPEVYTGPDSFILLGERSPDIGHLQNAEYSGLAAIDRFSDSDSMHRTHSANITSRSENEVLSPTSTLVDASLSTFGDEGHRLVNDFQRRSFPRRSDTERLRSISEASLASVRSARSSNLGREWMKRRAT